MYKIFTCLLLLIPTILSGCARNVDGTWKAPFVYRIDVQQGNVVDQEMIDRLRPGMDKNQVKFVMGTPLIKDTFHSNRWDYIYIMEPGGGERTQRRITLFFEDEKLAYVEGDIKIGERKAAEELTRKERAVDVPLDYHEPGFFDKMFDKDEPEAVEETVTDIDSETEAGTEAIVEEQTTEKTPATEQKTTALPATKSIVTKTDETTTIDENTETIADKQQDKNLLRRFWDRVTTGAEDSGLAEGEEETERDIRDAEVLESAGGEL